MGASRSAAGGGGDRGTKAGGNGLTAGAFVAQAGLHLKRLELAGGTDTLFRKRMQWVAAKVPAVLVITKYSNMFRRYQGIHLEELSNTRGPEGGDLRPYAMAQMKMFLTEMMPNILALVSTVCGYALCKPVLGSFSRYFKRTPSPGLGSFFSLCAGGILFGMPTMKVLSPYGQVKAAEIKANVPLLPGKIPTGDAMCEDAMNIYAMAGEEFWDKYRDSITANTTVKKNQSDAIAMFDAIENLALNCARRKAFVKARTNDSGLRVGLGKKAESTGETSIPEPGVPAKYPIDKKTIGKDSDGDPANSTGRWLESITLAMDQDKKFSKNIRPPNSDAWLRAATGGGHFEINKTKTARTYSREKKNFTTFAI